MNKYTKFMLNNNNNNNKKKLLVPPPLLQISTFKVYHLVKQTSGNSTSS